jgi:hypothetical protein
MATKLEEITGVFVEERWRRDNFFIGKIRIGHRTVGVKGEADPGELKIGLEYRFYGTMDSHEKYGDTFSFRTFILAEPHGEHGIKQYLMQCPNIGPATARALWDKLGSQAVRVLREEPDVAMAAVPALKPDVAERASRHLAELSALEDCSIELMGLLDGRGFPKNTSREAVKAWGNKAAERIKKNPYLLLSFRGCGFLRTDKLYLDRGHSPERIRRQAFCSWHALASDTNGNTWFPLEFAAKGIKARVSGARADVDKAITWGERYGRGAGGGYGMLVTRIDDQGRSWVAEGRKAQAEDSVARRAAEACFETPCWPSMDDPAFEELTLTPHQLENATAGMSGGCVGILRGSPGTGKAQPLDAMIATPSGWRRMGDLQVGDLVIGKSGRAISVTGVFPQGVRPVYRVTMSDGSQTKCCDEHLWFTKSRTDRKLGRAGKVRSLSEIRDTLNRSDRGPNHSIPMVGPVEFDEQDLPLDPYLLGVLLGDGCFRVTSVGLSNPDQFIVDAVEELLPQECILTRYGDSDIDYQIVKAENRNNSAYRNPVIQAIKELGLCNKKSTEKFIPDRYKFASAATRLAVLQGLLDTDGHCEKCGINVEYSTSSKQLADDVLFLIRSLGGVSRITSRIPAYVYAGERREGATSYRMLVSLPPSIDLFRLPRKQIWYRPRTKYQPSRRIVKIERVGDAPVQCISVDAADQLYVTDDFIVTHNTRCAAAIIKAAIRQLGAGHVAVCAPTNKAAVRLSEVMQGYGVRSKATSIHRLLVVDSTDGGWSFKFGSGSPLPYRLIVVDEASMIDTGLMSSLIAARAPNTCILFIGDPNQLPPVSHGRPFADMISAGLPCGELTEIQRNAGTIVKVCAAIRDEQPWEPDKGLDPASGANLTLKYAGNGKRASDAICEMVQNIRDWELTDNDDRIIDPIEDVQVIVAVNKKTSPVGRIALNRRLQDVLNLGGETIEGAPFRVGDKIICTENGFFPAHEAIYGDSDGQCFVANGEQARVLEVHEKMTIAWLTSPDRKIRIPRGKPDKKDKENENGDDDANEKPDTGCAWDLAYAITCHKMQGSECKMVIVAIDDYAGARFVCSREWMTTAISRAKFACVMVGKRSVLDGFLRRVALGVRKTFLVESLTANIARLRMERAIEDFESPVEATI